MYPRWKRPLWSALGYAGTAILAIASFVLLHHIGNQTPTALVAQKAADEFAAEPVAWGTRQEAFKGPWEYCYLTGAVLAGSMPSKRPFHDALVPRILTFDPAFGDTRSGGYCETLRRLVTGPDRAQRISAMPVPPCRCGWCLAFPPSRVDGARVETLGGTSHMPTHRWHGSKALYAIGLRYLTIREYHDLIRTATYGAYVALAAALLLLGGRALLVASPVVVFGWLWGGIDHVSDVAKGTPYVWAVLTPALLALLLRFGAGRAATRLFCFFAGLLASYLWLFDGGNFLAAALVGLVAWLHHFRLPAKPRAAQAAVCVLAHTAGFLVGLAACSIVRGSLERLHASVARVGARIWTPEPRDLHGRDIGAWTELVPLGVSATQALIAATVLALAMAVLIAACRAWRRQWAPLQELLWIAALGLAPLVHFVLPNDLPFRAARLAHLPLALCWSALLAVLLRAPRPGVHALASVAGGGALLAGWLAWQHFTATGLLRADDSAPPRLSPLIRGYFDVYYVADEHRLIYRRDDCDAVDAKRRFVLKVHPQDLTALPAERRAAGYAERTFYFIGHHLFTFGGGCTAIVDLPPYPIAKIATERYCCFEGEPKWGGSANLIPPSTASTDGG